MNTLAVMMKINGTEVKYSRNKQFMYKLTTGLLQTYIERHTGLQTSSDTSRTLFNKMLLRSQWGNLLLQKHPWIEVLPTTATSLRPLTVTGISRS